METLLNFHDGESNRGPLACQAKTLQLELNLVCLFNVRSRREKNESFTGLFTAVFRLIKTPMLPSYFAMKELHCIK